MIEKRKSNKISDEINIILTTKRLFGFKKMIKFVFALPKVIYYHWNRPAYESIGNCKIMINELEIFLKHVDVRYIDEIIVKQSYTHNEEFFIHPHYTVVDLGAQLGIFTLLAASYAKNGKVFSVEPEKESYQFLCENGSVETIPESHYNS